MKGTVGQKGTGKDCSSFPHITNQNTSSWPGKVTDELLVYHLRQQLVTFSNIIKSFKPGYTSLINNEFTEI